MVPVSYRHGQPLLIRYCIMVMVKSDQQCGFLCTFMRVLCTFICVLCTFVRVPPPDYKISPDLTRFNKIALQSPYGKWTRKSVAYRESNDYSSMCNIFVNFVFKHITLVALTQSINNVFHSFIISVKQNTFLYLICTVPTLTLLRVL